MKDKALEIVFVVVLVAAVGLGIYFYQKRSSGTVAEIEPEVQVVEKVDVCPASSEMLSDMLKSAKPWKDMFTFFRKYVPECDHGDWAAKISTVTLSLLDEVKFMKELETLRDTQPKFFQFVLDHVATGTDAAYLNKIKTDAKTKCKLAGTACQDLIAACDSALDKLEN